MIIFNERGEDSKRNLRKLYMSQVQIKESRIAKVMEGIGMFFSALGATEPIEMDAEEVIKKSGIKELVNSNERIKNIESIFEDKGTSIKQVKENLQREEGNKAPKIKNSIIKTNIQETEKDEDLER